MTPAPARKDPFIMLGNWIPYELALVGALRLGCWFLGWRRRRLFGFRSIGGTLLLCLAVASLIAAGAIAAFDQLERRWREGLVSAPHPIIAAASGADTFPAGTPAPDFTLPRLDNGAPVHLAELTRRRPVVLVFGGFGCGYFCARLDQVRQLQSRYGSQTDFVLVYINNRHPEPAALQAVVADRSAPLDAPVNRLARIREGMRQYGLSLTCVIDSADDRVQNAYQAFPARLVIVDQMSKIAFDSGSVLSSGLDTVGAAAWLQEHTCTTKAP
jgi:hypothetical protein